MNLLRCKAHSGQIVSISYTDRFGICFHKFDGTSYGIINVKEVYDQPTQKTLSEARGYVISDYQEYLEKQWIQNLESSYPLKINETALKSMVKK